MPLPHFDPFGWAARFLPDRWLHAMIRAVMLGVFAAFLVRRTLEYAAFASKPLWAAETALYACLVLAFATRRDPVVRSSGVAEILLPLVGAALPSASWRRPRAPRSRGPPSCGRSSSGG